MEEDILTSIIAWLVVLGIGNVIGLAFVSRRISDLEKRSREALRTQIGINKIVTKEFERNLNSINDRLK